VQKTIRCKKCHRAFEGVGERGDSKLVDTRVTCPYDDCHEETEILWPLESPCFVRMIPSEM